MADTTLTNKVRNPRNLNEWMDIWTAIIKKKEDNSYSYTINPSENWNISADNLSNIPVDKISSIDFNDTVDEAEKNYTKTNVTITSEPADGTLGLTGGVALTNTDGSISERPFNNNSDSYLSGTGTFISLPSYSLTGATDNSNVKVTLNKNNNATSNITIDGSGKITTTYNNNTIILNLANKSITSAKIDWDTPYSISDGNGGTTTTTTKKEFINNIGLNTKETTGLVPAPYQIKEGGDAGTAEDESRNKVWGTDGNGNPTWKTISSTGTPTSKTGVTDLVNTDIVAQEIEKDTGLFRLELPTSVTIKGNTADDFASNATIINTVSLS